MNLDMFSLEELLLVAMRSEIESKKIYLDLEKKVKNALLKDKLEFLAAEEESHRAIVEEIFKNHFPDEKITIPRDSIVPLPEVKMTEDTPISKVLKSAMDAELAANEFYKSLSQRFPEDTKIKNTLLYFAEMEMGHYKLLELEKDSLERFEEADVYWPMVHAGP